MSITVRSCPMPNSEWESLAQTSHQTSLFVSSSWLAADRPVVIGAFENGHLVSGLVSHEFTEVAAAPYQGLVLSARSRPAHTHALLEWVEGIGGMPIIWNAPSLVDIRPFLERASNGVIWQTHIRYTYFVENRGPLDAPPESCPKTNERINRLTGTLSPGNMGRCLLADCVDLYEDGDALVAWGVDAQGRGYLVAGAGYYIPLAKRLCGAVESADLGGTPSWAKDLNPRLRTSYGLVRTA